jgi:hypothetical protein
MSEIVVINAKLEVGKTYKTVEITRKEGMWPNEKCFTTNVPRYVGKYIETLREGGFGDGARIWSVFDDNGKINRVDYSYEGNTSFIESE